MGCEGATLILYCVIAPSPAGGLVLPPAIGAIGAQCIGMFNFYRRYCKFGEVIARTTRETVVAAPSSRTDEEVILSPSLRLREIGRTS